MPFYAPVCYISLVLCGTLSQLGKEKILACTNFLLHECAPAYPFSFSLVSMCVQLKVRSIMCVREELHVSTLKRHDFLEQVNARAFSPSLSLSPYLSNSSSFSRSIEVFDSLFLRNDFH